MNPSKRIRFLDLFWRETPDTAAGIRLFAVTFCSALSNVTMLVIITSASHATEDGNPDFRYLMLFATAVSLYVLSQRYILSRITVTAHTVIDGVRTRIADKVRACDFRKLEELGHEDIYSRITKETAIITQTSPAIMGALQSVVMVIMSMIYIAVLSTTAFWLAIVSIVTSAGVYLAKDRENAARMRVSAAREDELFRFLTHILDGFKEIKVNRKKSESVARHLNDLSTSLRDAKVKALLPMADNYIFSIVFFYLLIAAIVFVLPNLIEPFSDVVVKLTMAVLFIVGPLTNAVGMVPLLSESNVAVESIESLEAMLDEANDGIDTAHQVEIPDKAEFGAIRFRDASFEYLDPEGHSLFRVGPVDLEIVRGEILFIMGGNGSGKSTLLKLLTGLYHPTHGSIWLDDVPIQRENIQAFRELYSIIFSDFHLFDRLYGLNEVDPDRVQELLNLMELQTKTNYDGNRFTNLDLSTGQRKRLALLVTYLEDSPVYVFDEWAADQDPHFRAYFYETLLRDLKERGKTVVVVTHDDRYFSVADHIFKMELGKFVPLSAANGATTS